MFLLPLFRFLNEKLKKLYEKLKKKNSRRLIESSHTTVAYKAIIKNVANFAVVVLEKCIFSYILQIGRWGVERIVEKKNHQM